MWLSFVCVILPYFSFLGSFYLIIFMHIKIVTFPHCCWQMQFCHSLVTVIRLLYDNATVASPSLQASRNVWAELPTRSVTALSAHVRTVRARARGQGCRLMATLPRGRYLQLLLLLLLLLLRQWQSIADSTDSAFSICSQYIISVPWTHQLTRSSLPAG